jgi:hypothetical protein
MSKATDRMATIADYAAAEKFFENTKHIRGRSEHSKPLGERRDINRFSITKSHWMNDKGGSDGECKPSYNCVLYNTTVVRFRFDGVVAVRDGGYVTQSTHAFIRRLTNVSVSTHEGATVLHAANGRFEIPRGSNSLDSTSLLMRRNRYWQYEVLNGEPQYRLEINRTGTSAIRRRYAEFIKYFGSMVALRKEKADGRYWGQANGSEIVKFTEGELVQSVAGGMEITINSPRSVYQFARCLDDRSRNDYSFAVTKFIALISDTSDKQHTSFYGAFMLMCALSGVQQRTQGGNIACSAVAIRKNMLEVLYKWHSDEAIRRVDLPLGELGSRKYMSWLKSAYEELA